LSGAGIVLLATGIYILADALKKLGAMQWDEIWRGLTTMALALAGIAIALKLMPPQSLLSAAAILIVATSLRFIADALGHMGKFDWGTIVRGLVAMAGAIGIIAIALRLIPRGAIFSAAGIYIVATSLGLIVKAVKTFGNMSVGEIAKGLITMAAALGIIAVALHFMEATIPGALALVVVAYSLSILADVMTKFGELSWGDIFKGIAILAMFFGIVTVFSLVLAPVVPIMLGLGAAIALIGIGIGLLGGGVLALGAGLTLIAAAGVGAAGAIVAFVSAVFSLVPMMVVTIGSAFITLLQIIVQAIPEIVNMLVLLIIQIVDGLVKVMPKIIELFKLLIDATIKILDDNAPNLIEAGIRLLLAVLRGIRDHIGEITTVVADIIIRFLNAMAEKQPQVLEAGANYIIAFIRGLSKTIKEKAPELGAAGGELAVAIIQGMVTGLWSGVGKVVDAAKNVAKKALDAAKDWLGISSPSKEFMKVGMFATAGMVLGLLSLVGKVEDASTTVANTALETVQNTLSALGQAVDANMQLQPTITPVFDLTEVQKGASQIGNLLTTTPLSVAGTAAVANAAAADKQENDNIAAENEDSSGNGTTIQFNQTNNSPKALSNAEIYRNTNSLIATVKGSLPTK
jgi:hypothetical protein